MKGPIDKRTWITYKKIGNDLIQLSTKDWRKIKAELKRRGCELLEEDTK